MDIRIGEQVRPCAAPLETWWQRLWLRLFGRTTTVMARRVEVETSPAVASPKVLFKDIEVVRYKFMREVPSVHGYLEYWRQINQERRAGTSFARWWSWTAVRCQQEAAKPSNEAAYNLPRMVGVMRVRDRVLLRKLLAVETDRVMADLMAEHISELDSIFAREYRRARAELMKFPSVPVDRVIAINRLLNRLQVTYGTDR